MLGGQRTGWQRIGSVVASMAVLSMGATTCWVWDGTKTRLVRAEHQLELLNSESPATSSGGMLPLVEQAERVIRTLREQAKRDDLAGQRARVWLARLREGTHR